MFVLARAIAYATLFVGFLLVFVPASLIRRSGLAPPSEIGPIQVLGAIVTMAGALLALWCILTFVFVGKGTPAPFDPPRALVVRGPYRYVRNPMYIGGGAALLGAAIYYQSMALTAYAVLFVLAMNLFVRLSEEPILRRSFGRDYEDYCRQVGRWWPLRAR